MAKLKLPVIEERARGERCCDPSLPHLEWADAEAIASDFDILANPIRITLIDLLARAGGKVCVCDLEASVPVKQPTVSHHLKLLLQSGLISREKRGLWSYYFVNKEAVRAQRKRMIELLNTYA